MNSKLPIYRSRFGKYIRLPLKVVYLNILSCMFPKFFIFDSQLFEVRALILVRIPRMHEFIESHGETDK